MLVIFDDPDLFYRFLLFILLIIPGVASISLFCCELWGRRHEVNLSIPFRD